MQMLNELADAGHDDVPYKVPPDSSDSPITACPPTRGPLDPRSHARSADSCVLGS